MTDRRTRGRLASLRLAGIVGLAAALTVLLGAVLVADQRHRARVEADATVRAAVASAVASVGADLRAQVGRWADDGPASSGEAALRSARSVESLPTLLQTAVRARDTGRPQLADLAEPPSIVVPVYAGASPPPTTGQRRSALTGYRLVPLSPTRALTGLAPAGGGLEVRGPAQTVAATAGAAPAGAVSFATGLALPEAAGWAVAAWVPGPGTPTVAWVWLLGLLVLFGGLGTIGCVARLRWMDAEERRSRLDRRQSLVDGLAPLVQDSLDLGQLAPAVSSHLVHTLSLAGFTLSVPSDAGERPLFAWGTPPDATVLPLRKPPDRLDRGRTYTVSLTRGGRVLGILRAVAGEPLLRADLDALATATQLLGSAMAHAEMFTRQQQVVDRLRAVDELKTVFLATASHELRTPVTAIVGFSSLLLDGWDELDPDQGRLLLERVVANAHELGGLIEQLLDFARLERGIRPAGDELLDVGTTVAEILSARSELVSEHVLDSDLAQGCTVRGSASAVERIVTNLVANAGKYSPPGTRIFVTVRQEDARVAVVVEDEGPGIAPEDREHVFSRFYRGHGAGVTRTGGVGIGLAIVAEYAASMAGTATVTDAPSGGARFTVVFPTAEARDAIDSPARRPDVSRNGAQRVPIS